MQNKSNFTYLLTAHYTSKNQCCQIHFNHLGFPLFRSYRNKESQKKDNSEPQRLVSEPKDFIYQNFSPYEDLHMK